MRISSEMSFDEVRSRLTITHELEAGGSLQELRLSYRLYSQQELKALLANCGFTRIDIFGGLDGAPYDDKARKLVAVASK